MQAGSSGLLLRASNALRGGRVGLVAEQALQRYDARVRDSAGNNRVEVAQVGGDIEGKAVRGDPARDMHANGAQLAWRGRGALRGTGWRRQHPDPGAAGDPLGAHSEIRGDADHQLLDRRDVFAHVFAVRLEIEDRVPDDLPWPVVGDVAAAAGLEDGEAPRFQLVVGPEDVARFRAAPERDHPWVLEEEQRVGHELAGARLDQLLLRGQAVLVLDQPQPADV